MATRKLTFANADGVMLSARLDMPADGRPDLYALFAHCFTCGKDLKAAHYISKSLNQRRIAVFRFDFTGLGESAGDFSETTFSSNVADLLSAARFMEASLEGPRLLIGHSLGGAAVLQAASGIPTSRAVVTIGAPADPAHVMHHLASSLPQIREQGQARVELAGRPFTIKKAFVDDVSATRMDDVVRRLGRALMVMHAPGDDVVGIDNAARLFTVARHPKSFVSLDTADHLLGDREDAQYAGGVIAAWAARYVGAPLRPHIDDPADNRIVARTAADGFYTEIMAGRHVLAADEPVSVGGTDRGPTPYDLLAASLGACTAMTLQMYADRKKWPLAEAVVRLRHEKIHAEDCRNCSENRTAVDRISRELELVGPLDGEQRRRLAEIADRCPVHRTLQGEIVVDTRLAETEPDKERDE
ncbi:MAG: bifunctional alpha/beta hydrolase/OsmC family protein [Pseudomonadota bacterium]